MDLSTQFTQWLDAALADERLPADIKTLLAHDSAPILAALPEAIGFYELAADLSDPGDEDFLNILKFAIELTKP